MVAMCFVFVAVAVVLVIMVVMLVFVGVGRKQRKGEHKDNAQSKGQKVGEKAFLLQRFAERVGNKVL